MFTGADDNTVQGYKGTGRGFLMKFCASFFRSAIF
ncbi:MAG: hypothetical protein ACSLEN_11900 [Candidatus Malihini olakiniferum]